MSTKNLICILPSYDRYTTSSLVLARAGIPLALSQRSDDAIMNVFKVDESQYKLNEHYKIGLDSMNPLLIPSHNYYQSDLNSILRGYADSGKDQYDPDVGFYTRKQVFFESDIEVGDLLLTSFEHSTMTNFAVVDRVMARNTGLKKFLFGRYKLQSIVGDTKAYFVGNLTNRSYNAMGQKMILCETYKLTPVSRADILDREPVTQRVRAGSPVPPHKQVAAI